MLLTPQLVTVYGYPDAAPGPEAASFAPGDPPQAVRGIRSETGTSALSSARGYDDMAKPLRGIRVPWPM